MAISDFTARRAAFRKLHQSGCFVIPNPWNVGSARYLRHLGFQALATTSSGFAFSMGLPDDDSAVPRDVVLGHFAEIVAGSELPVNADFKSGYAHEPEGVAHNVRLCVETGVAGLSIEDSTGDDRTPLYHLALAVERVKAARLASDESGAGVLLTARAECYLVGHAEPLRESIPPIAGLCGSWRGRAVRAWVERARGHPGHRDRGQSQACQHPDELEYGVRVADLAEMGVRRVSVGSALARAAWSGFIHAAEAIAREGSFAGFDGSVSFSELNVFFRVNRGPKGK